MKTLKLSIVCLAAAMLCVNATAQLYRWVDADGQVHYSDTPRNGAEEIELKQTNVFSSGRSSGSSPTEIGDQSEEQSEDQNGVFEEEKLVAYRQLIVTTPSDGETLWNTGGSVNVQLNILPGLQKGHGIVFFFNGRPVNDKPVPGTSFTLQDVYRGTHTVRASVYAANGALLINGPTSTFYVRQGTGG